jgi:hypothetical protein
MLSAKAAQTGQRRFRVKFVGTWFDICLYLYTRLWFDVQSRNAGLMTSHYTRFDVLPAEPNAHSPRRSLSYRRIMQR